jgi:DNA invertase Pin-like site-specific DNA recombinase
MFTLNGMHFNFSASEIWLYPRKSTASESASKSIGDQIEVMLETCQELGLPATEHNVHAEAPGHGGDEWWKGGGRSGLRNDRTKKDRFRPVLTEMMEAIIDGTCKCVLCYSQDRLWRDTGICDAVIDLFLEYDVTLIDRNGLVDIKTPDGRNKVRSMAVSAQTYRENAAEDSKRGVKKQREKGILVVSANTLGFRGAGKHSRQAVVIPEELVIVERIFRMYVHGENNSGPMSTTHIAARLMEEGFQWMPDTLEIRPFKRTERRENFIYEWQITRLLRNCRYQGRQPHGGKEWPCPAFLVDGKPVLPIKLYEAAQEKLKASKKVGNAANRKRALMGLLRCGQCAQTLYTAPVGKKRADGSRTVYWRRNSSAAWRWCTHKLPSIRETILDEYVNQVFAPLLLADLRERAALTTESDLADSLASLRRRLCDLEDDYERQLQEMLAEGVTAKSIAIAERKHLETTAAVYKSIKEAEALVREMNELDVHLEDLSSMPPETRRDALHRSVRWIAVLPTTAPREKHPTYYYERRPKDGGRVVFCTAYGTYHCATLEYGDIGDTRPQYSLRPSTADEVIGTLADFPDPQGFLIGLKRSYDGRKYKYDPFEVAPELATYGPAEFEVDENEQEPDIDA